MKADMDRHEPTGASTSPRGLMLLSIHPRHASLILAGSKTVELRRTRPSVQPGQPIAIYTTAPTSSLVATCRVDKVTTGAPDDLRETLLPKAGVLRDEYTSYFRGARLAVGIHLRDVQPLERHVGLEDMRRRTRFFPPQTWHFIDAPGLDRLVGGHEAHSALAAML